MMDLKPSLGNLTYGIDAYEECADFFRDKSKWGDIFRGKLGGGRGIEVLVPLLRNRRISNRLTWDEIVRDAIINKYTNEAAYVFRVLAIVEPSLQDELAAPVQALMASLDAKVHMLCEHENEEARKVLHYFARRDRTPLMEECRAYGSFRLENHQEIYNIYKDHD